MTHSFCNECAGKKGQQEAASGLFQLTLPLLRSTSPQPAQPFPQEDTSTWFQGQQPSAAFWQALATHPAEAARAAASYGLLVALQHASIAEILLSVGGGEGDAKRAFLALSQLQPSPAFQQHLLLFWSRASESEGTILVDILNTGDANSQVGQDIPASGRVVMTTINALVWEVLV